MCQLLRPVAAMMSLAGLEKAFTMLVRRGVLDDGYTLFHNIITPIIYTIATVIET
jgi:hypothetical protein